jgi:uncharacterized NAD(P)/FAD-binding protein YdhS
MDGPECVRIAVIGGGLSGAAFAIHFLRDHADIAAALDVIEPRATLGAGLAYGTEDPAHRTNVAAALMSLFAEDPARFDTWLRTSDQLQDDPAATLADGRIYAGRSAFSRYVADELGLAARSAPRATLNHVRDRAIHAERRDGAFRLELESGKSLTADIIVLATGHAPPSLPASLAQFADPAGRIIHDPWAPGALDPIGIDDPVLIVGTGLSMCDMVAGLHRRGHRALVTAVSRRGLLPRPRTLLPVEPFGDFTHAPETRTIALLRRVRDAIDRARLDGRPWEDVVAALRQQARIVWGALPTIERRRLLRHLRPFWDVHRYQSAPQVDRLLAQQRRTGRLVLATGTLVSARADADGVTIRVTGREDSGFRDHRASWVVNCSGPGRGAAIANPVMAALAAAGVIREDSCALGLDVDAEGCAIGRDGVSQPDVIVVGPLARAQYGELMGLPQISAQPREVASYLASRLVR